MYKSKEEVEADTSGWYAEDTTVLSIKRFSTTVQIPQTLAVAWKVPASYGYNAPKNKADYFTNSKSGIRVYTEAAFEFPRAYLISADSVPYNIKMYNTGSLDFVGNELTGTIGEEQRTPEAQFIIHNASVNDMY